jgi:predicted alpha/beta-fold hydrolase
MGHVRTIGHLLATMLRPPPPPASEPWKGELEDPQTGRVLVTGRLSRGGDGRLLVVLVHGLGGCADSPYLCHAARVAGGLGVDTLRLDLRGADPRAGDFYHAGLAAELHAAVADRALAGYQRIAVLGYSMGGHVALRFAAEVEEPRVTAVAAVCAPLHLRTVSEDFDRPSRWLYRTWVLRHLRRCFAAIESSGGGLPHAYELVRRARTFREWDALTVVPRFGFADPDDYYARASAAGALGRLRVPALLVASEIDPVITPRAIEPHLPAHAEVGKMPADLARVPHHAAAAGRPASFTLLWHADAGHVGFPGGLALESRLLDWLAATA